jgi:hypothetical protein
VTIVTNGIASFRLPAPAESGQLREKSHAMALLRGARAL